jgi:hypothetical protein
MTLDEKIKEAELEKLLAEVEKTRAEQKTIELDYDKQLKELSINWFLKEKFWKNFVSIFLGFSILGFYTNYIILPSFQKDNIELSLENSRHKMELNDKEIHLKEDSIKLKIEKIKNDSFNAVVYSKGIIIDSIGKAYKNLLIAIERYKDKNIKKINEATYSVKKVLKNLNLNDSLNSIENKLKNKVSVSFKFLNGIGKSTLAIFSNGILIQMREVNSSATIEVELTTGLYVFSISGVSTGNATIDVQGKDITVTPNTPINFYSGMFNESITVGIK